MNKHECSETEQQKLPAKSCRLSCKLIKHWSVTTNGEKMPLSWCGWQRPLVIKWLDNIQYMRQESTQNTPTAEVSLSNVKVQWTESLRWNDPGSFFHVRKPHLQLHIQRNL